MKDNHAHCDGFFAFSLALPTDYQGFCCEACVHQIVADRVNENVTASANRQSEKSRSAIWIENESGYDSDIEIEWGIVTWTLKGIARPNGQGSVSGLFSEKGKESRRYVGACPLFENQEGENG